MKKYFTYVCLLALALFAFATHAEAGKFKFKLKTASTVTIDLTKIFPDSSLAGVKFTGLTTDSSGVPGGVMVGDTDILKAVHVDTDHHNNSKPIEVDDPNNVIKKIYFTPDCGIAKEDLTLLDFDATDPMDIEELSFAGMNPSGHFIIHNAPKSTKNLKLLDMTNAREFYVYEIFLEIGVYKGSTKLEKLLWSPHYGPGEPKFIGQLVRANRDLQLIDFSNTLDAIGHGDEQKAAQAVRKVIEYIPHYAENKLTLKVKNAWESTVNVIAPLKKVTIKPTKTVTGTADPKVFVTTYKFKYTLENGEEVEIVPNTTRLSEDKVAKITLPSDLKALLYKTADGVYYSLNEGKNHNGDNSHADAYGAKVVPPYDQIIEIVYDGSSTKWYVENSNTKGVPNPGLTGNQTVYTKVLGKKSNIQFSYYVEGEGYANIPVADLGFVSVKGIDASAPTTSPISASDDNYRYGRTMTGFTAENAPKIDGYRFKEFSVTNYTGHSKFDGPDLVLKKENAYHPVLFRNWFAINLEYVPVHKVKLMYPVNLPADATVYAVEKTYEIDKDGHISGNQLPTYQDMQLKYPGYELVGWQFVEKMEDLKPEKIDDPTVTLKRAAALAKVIDKDYYVVAMLSKLFTVTFRDYNAGGQIADVKVVRNISWNSLIEKAWFPAYAGREGYTAKGWEWNGTVKTPEDWAGRIVISDLIFTANYEINKYAVKFTHRDATNAEVSETYTVEHGKKVQAADLTASNTAAAAFKNHTFEAWQLNGADTNPAEYVVTSAAEFKARYAYKPLYKFTNEDGSDFQAAQRADINNKVINAPSNNPANDGDREFAGWTLDGTSLVAFPYTIADANFAPGTVAEIPAQDLIFKAKYVEPYKVSFDMHGVMTAPSSWKKTAKRINKGYVLPNPTTFDINTYKFLGWSVDVLNADKLYQAGENFTDYNADFTLHAAFHQYYNTQLNPEGIADFCARVGVAPSYKEAKDYIENFDAISEATVVDIVDLNNVTAVVKKVEFIQDADVTTTGVKPIKVQLTYTDGSTDQVTVYMTVLDATDLKNVIAEGEHELKNPTYTDVSGLRTAIASAKTVYAKNDACKAELEAAKNAIIAALNALVVKYEPLPEDQIAPADRIAIEYGINVAGAATYNATYGGAEVANYRVFKKGYTFVMNVTPAAGYSLEFFTIYKYNAKAKAFEVKDRVETFAQTLRYRFAEAGRYKVVANFSKGEYTFTYGVRNEAGKGAEFVAMYNGSAIKSGDKVPAGAKVRLVVALQDKARIVKWFVNDAVAAISAESRDNEFTVNADTKVEVELANVTAAEAVAASVKVGPNPFTNFFVIRGAQDFATYYVLNATGNRVAEGMVAGMNEVRVNAQSFAPGFYVVVLKKADGTVQAVKMIKR